MIGELILGSIGLVLAISFIIIAKIIEMDTQPDKMIQNISNISKLIEGRFTIEQLLSLDISSIENIISNEFHNIDVSYKELKETSAIKVYTKKKKI